jgi:hypothetical protein
MAKTESKIVKLLFTVCKQKLKVTLNCENSERSYQPTMKTFGAVTAIGNCYSTTFTPLDTPFKFIFVCDWLTRRVCEKIA